MPRIDLTGKLVIPCYHTDTHAMLTTPCYQAGTHAMLVVWLCGGGGVRPLLIIVMQQWVAGVAGVAGVALHRARGQLPTRRSLRRARYHHARYSVRQCSVVQWSG